MQETDKSKDPEKEDLLEEFENLIKEAKKLQKDYKELMSKD